MADPITSITFHDTTSADKAYLTAVAAVVTTGGALKTQSHNPVNATSSSLTMSLPTGQKQGTEISVEKVDSSANAVVITGNIRGLSSSVTIYWQYETVGFKADSTGSWWPQYGHKTKSALDAAYAAKPTGTPAAGKYVDGATNAWTALPASATVNDATTSTKGVVQLAGDLAGTAASPALASIVTAGSVGSASQIPIITYDAKGRITGTSTAAAAVTPSDATTSAKGVVQLAGDLAGTATSPALATTGVTAGSYGGASAVPVFTVDAKGRITAASTVAVSGSGSSAAAAVLSAQMYADGSGSTYSLPATTFQTIPLNVVNVDSVSGFSTSSFIYTVPTTGTYAVFGKIRLADSPSGAQNVGVGVYTANSDNGSFTWDMIPASSQRNSVTHSRVENFAAGAQVRLYAYSNSAVTLTGAYLSVVRLDGTSAMQNPFTTTGDLVYGSGSTPTRLAAPISATKRYLSSTGTGTAAQAPSWDIPQVSEILGAAPLASPTFTGTPNTTTPASLTDNGTRIPSTAWVQSNIAPLAPLASPTLTGTPAAPTATAGTSTTQIATTAFATAADNLKANIASPTFTGTPAAPTAAGGTNTTQIATTAFVATAVSGITPVGNPGLGCSIWKNNTQTISANTGTQITFDSTEYNDSTSLYTVGTNQITVNSAGLYLITMSGLGIPSSASMLGIYMMINGSTNVQESNGYATASGSIRLTGSRLVKLTAGSTVQLWTYFAASGGNIQGSAAKDTSITISRVGAAFDATYAPLLSPALTGTPTAPTATAGTSTTQLATTAFVAAAAAAAQTTLIGVNAQTANYTLTLADAGKLITVSSGSQVVISFPQNATVAFPIGTVINMANLNTGGIYIVGTGSTVMNSPAGFYVKTQYAQATAIKIATDTWLVSGQTSVS